MRKGYKETLPKRVFDDEGKPIWGYQYLGKKKQPENASRSGGGCDVLTVQTLHARQHKPKGRARGMRKGRRAADSGASVG